MRLPTRTGLLYRRMNRARSLPKADTNRLFSAVATALTRLGICTSAVSRCVARSQTRTVRSWEPVTATGRSSTTRRHTANDGLAPITFERQMAQKRRASTAQLRAEVAYHRLHTLRGLTPVRSQTGDLTAQDRDLMPQTKISTSLEASSLMRSVNQPNNRTISKYRRRRNIERWG
jgi:hypothetical protein